MLSVPTDKLVNELHKTQPYTLLVVVALSFFAVWGYTQYARAADVDALAADVDARFAALESKVGANGDKIDTVLSFSVAAEIRTQVALHCASDSDATKEAIQRTIDTLQQQYKALTDAFYPAGACGN